jgi:hypothetical protein
MKKFFALAIVAAIVLALPALAGEMKKTDKAEMAKGTISAWDDATKTFKVKEESGTEWTFAMMDKSEVHGTAKVGETVMVKYTKDEAGKMWAHHVFVGKDEIAKAERMQHEKETKKAGTN